MSLVPNSEDLTGALSGLMVASTTRFKNTMDGLLVDGWVITLDLPAVKLPCPANCTFNPTYDKYVGVNTLICPVCKGQGSVFEQRQTNYKCNRRWTNNPLDKSSNGGQNTLGGMVFGNYVRVKTHISSFNHIQQSLGATLDGLKLKLYEEPRKTGWAGTDLYVISWWERANKKTNG